METENNRKCSFEECDKPATFIAKGKTKHPEIACYCDEHAEIVSNEWGEDPG